MCVHFDPCGPLGPTPPNSRLSSLLWQSEHKICVPMLRPCVTPSISNILANRLGCGNGLLLTCITGWLDVLLIANCAITFRKSPEATSRTGKYPNAGFAAFPALVPWQRRQLSYSLTAGNTTVTPSAALTPAMPFCDTRTAGGGVKLVT